jgi:hypothetical protein
MGDGSVVISSSRLDADTEMDLYVDGVLVQSLTVHTSCSKTLAIGNVFGALTLTGFQCSDGGSSGMDSSSSAMTMGMSSTGSDDDNEEDMVDFGMYLDALMADGGLEMLSDGLAGLDSDSAALASDLLFCLSPGPVPILDPFTSFDGPPLDPNSPVPEVGPAMSMFACISGLEDDQASIVDNNVQGDTCVGWTVDGTTGEFHFRYGDIVIPNSPNTDTGLTPFDGAAHHIGVVVEPYPAPAPETCQCRPSSISFEYIGGGCEQGNNDQEGKADCSGSSLGTSAASISASEAITSGSAPFAVGDVFTVEGSTNTAGHH